MPEVQVSKRFTKDGIQYMWICPKCGEMMEFYHWSDTMCCSECDTYYKAVVIKV